VDCNEKILEQAKRCEMMRAVSPSNSIYITILNLLASDGVMAEWSKALASGSLENSLVGNGVGSNPTDITSFFAATGCLGHIASFTVSN
jgi:hypothetical protein